jgi:polar amino acid transport system substrate-binding protein
VLPKFNLPNKYPAMKKIIVILFLLVNIPGVSADVLDKVLTKHVLRVGVSLYEPWVMQNKDGDLYGYEIQVAEQLAKDLSVNVEFVIVEWSDLITALKKNEIDIIISGMAITPRRALHVNFSDPYGDSGVSIAANIEKTKNINSLVELNSPEVIIGVVSASVSEPVAIKVFDQATIKSFIKSDDAIAALLKNDLHAFIEASPVPEFLALEYPSKVDAPLSKPLLSYKSAMAVNKGEQEFLNYINSWIIARTSEGWLTAKYQYWFDSLDWKK